MPTNRALAYSTQISHVSSGASINAGAFSGSADIANALSSTNHANYPLAEITLVATQGSSGAISSASNTILLYRRDMNVDGTADAHQPGTAHSQILVGAFICPAIASSVATLCVPCGNDVAMPAQCEFYIENKLNIPVAAGWKLLVKPKTDSFS